MADDTRAIPAAPAPLPPDDDPYPGLENIDDPVPAAAQPASIPDPVIVRGGPPVLAIVLISVAVLGLAAVGYLAWQRGLLATGDTGGSAVKVVNVDDSAAADGDAAVAGDPLDKLNDDIRGLRPYREWVPKVRAMDAELDATKIESADGKLTEATRQRLYELQPLGLQFARDYEAFEQRAARDQAPKLQSYQEILRAGFIARMERFVEKIGEAYAAEQGINNPVFTLSDTFIKAVETYGRADASGLREKWLASVHAQEQSALTDKFEPQIEDLKARIEKLKALHREVDAVLQGAPKYHIRGGIIGVTARNLLEVYDSLAGRVEAQVIEFEEFMAKLPAEHNVDEIDALAKEFTKLAQEDHFYAFRETYKIYEQDKELEHPAYQNLKNHYKFVEDHWPTMAGNYKQAYTASETLWERNWAQR